MAPLLVILAGVALRLFMVGHQGLWYDEALSVVWSDRPAAELLDRLRAEPLPNTYPPLHFLLLHMWFSLVGTGAVQARVLSVFFGTGAIAAGYMLSKRWFGEEVALFSAALLCVSQLGIMYSQEARSYALLLFLCVSATLLFVIALQGRGKLAWGAFVGVSAAASLTHYYGGFFVGCLFIYAWFCRRRYEISNARLIAAAAGMSVLCGSWALLASTALSKTGALVGDQPPWFAVDIYQIVTTTNTFNNGRFDGLLDGSPLWSYPIGAMLFTVPALWALIVSIMRRGRDSVSRERRSAVLLLASLWIVPTIVAIGLGYVGAPYNDRYVIASTAPYYVLVAVGTSYIRIRSLRYGVMAACMLYSVTSLRANYFIPYKENYRDAGAFVEREYETGDCYVVGDNRELPIQWTVYGGQHPPLILVSIDELTEGQVVCPRVWLVTYHRTSSGDREAMELHERLQESYSATMAREYHWVEATLYEPID